MSRNYCGHSKLRTVAIDALAHQLRNAGTHLMEFPFPPLPLQAPWKMQSGARSLIQTSLNLKVGPLSASP